MDFLTDLFITMACAHAHTCRHTGNDRYHENEKLCGIKNHIIYNAFTTGMYKSPIKKENSSALEYRHTYKVTGYNKILCR